MIGSDRAGGKVLATFQMASDSGAILGPIVVGLVVDALGYTTGFAVSGALLLAAVIPWLFARGSPRAPATAATGE